MMRAMRRWLLLVIVLLLPLRGWLGEAIAGEMHHGAAAAVQASHVAQHAHTAAGLARHDGVGHDHGATPQAGAQPQSSFDAGTCASCQVCSSVALAPTVTPTTGATFSQPRPDTVQLAYASAEPSLFFKPPRH